MMKKTIIIALVSGFAGASVALALAAFLCTDTAANRFLNYSLKSGLGYAEYDGIHLIESEMRGAKVYVKYENRGERIGNGAHFTILVRDESGNLVDELSGWTDHLVHPGEATETILMVTDEEGNRPELTGEIEVVLHTAYSKPSF
jgi:hypothetical protein